MNRPFCDSESAARKKLPLESAFSVCPTKCSAPAGRRPLQAPRCLQTHCRRKRNSARRGKRKTMHMVKFLRARFLLCSFPDIDEYDCKAFDTVSRPKYHMTDSRCLLSLILHQNRQNMGIVSYGSFSFYRLGMRNCLACKTICFPASGMNRPLPPTLSLRISGCPEKRSALAGRRSPRTPRYLQTHRRDSRAQTKYRVPQQAQDCAHGETPACLADETC